jgi:SAM-dependent methyltransferase
MSDDAARAQERITACWNGAAASYDAQPGHGLLSERERDAWHHVLRPALGEPPRDVLDVGTGTGFMAFRASELGHRATGIDLSESMLAVARATATSLPGLPSFQEGDAVAPPFAPASFDVIVNRHVLWTLRQIDVALSNWRNLLRTGGRLVIVDGIWWDPPGAEQAPPPDDDHPADEFYTPDVVAELHVRRLARVDQVADILREAGFTDVTTLDLTSIDDAEGHLESVRGRYALAANRG